MEAKQLPKKSLKIRTAIILAILVSSSFLYLIQLPAANATSTFYVGCATTQETLTTSSQYRLGALFVCPYSGTLDSVSWYGNLTTAYNCAYYIYLNNDNDNTIGAQLNSTSYSSIGTSTQWWSKALTGEVSVTAGQKVWLVLYTAGSNQYKNMSYSLTATNAQKIISNGNYYATTGCAIFANYTHTPIQDYNLTLPTTITAGQTFNTDVTVLDPSNNTATDYTGQVYFTSTDQTATLPYTSENKYTFQAGDSGTKTFSGFNLTTAGVQNVTVTDGTISKTANITVTATSAASLEVAPENSSMLALGTKTFTATSIDVFGNTVEDVTTETIWAIDVNAGGDWADNVYTAENQGIWTVTANYSGIVTTTTLTVVAFTTGYVGSPVVHDEEQTQANKAIGTRYYVNLNGTVASITFWGGLPSGSLSNVYMYIASDASYGDLYVKGSTVAQTDTMTISSKGWYTAYLTTPLNVTAGTYLWLITQFYSGTGAWPTICIGTNFDIQDRLYANGNIYAGDFPIYANYSYVNPINFTVQLTNDAGSTITPSTPSPYIISVLSSQMFSFAANEGYTLSHVFIDSVDYGAITNYTFSTVMRNHTISVYSFSDPAQSGKISRTSTEVRFAVISDTHSSNTVQTSVQLYFDKVLVDLPGMGTSFLVMDGDFIDTTVGFFPEQMSAFQSHITLNSPVPVFFAYGDHGKEFGKWFCLNRVNFDYAQYGQTSRGWYDYTNLPYYWSMVYQGINFVFTPSAFADDLYTSWLAKNLAANSGNTTIIFNHLPYVNVGTSTHDALYGMFNTNSQVIGVVSGHSHMGYTPYSLTNNAKQFWTNKAGNSNTDYISQFKYLLYVVNATGLYVYERNAATGATTNIYSYVTPTTVKDSFQVKYDLPYLMNDGMTVSLPTTQIEDATVTTWGVNTTQAANADIVWVPVDGVNQTSHGVFYNATGTDDIYWAYTDIFSNLDLTQLSQVNYCASFQVSGSTWIYNGMRLQLVNATDGETLTDSVLTQGDQEWGNTNCISILFNWEIYPDGTAWGGMNGGSPNEFGGVNPAGWNNCTLRAWVGVGQDTGPMTLTAILYAENRSFSWVELANSGTFSSQAINVTVNGEVYGIGNLNNVETSTMILPSVSGELYASVGGSYMAVIEVEGYGEPVLMLINPRETQKSGDTTSFGDRLASSTSPATSQTVIGMLKPVHFNGSVATIAAGMMFKFLSSVVPPDFTPVYWSAIGGILFDSTTKIGGVNVEHIEKVGPIN